jgi:hypothetical protein
VEGKISSGRKEVVEGGRIRGKKDEKKGRPSQRLTYKSLTV